MSSKNYGYLSDPAPFFAGFSMIILSEIGDKTFFIAAVLATKHSPVLVFCGTSLALIFMTLLSVILGRSFIHFFSPIYTSIISGILFFYFGATMVYEAMYSPTLLSDANKIQDIESNLPSPRMQFPFIHLTEISTEPFKLLNFMRRFTYARLENYFSMITFQAFYMIFLAEWGDRSQIGTIVLAASHDPLSIGLGVILAHCLCTLLAILGGQFLVKHLNEKLMNVLGGIIFLIFGISSFYNVF